MTRTLVPSFVPQDFALEPRLVWQHFATLCAIPRPSKKEAALRAHLRAWAEARALEVEEDATGNLILRKPATPGFESAPVVTLQGHLDMVCQKNDAIDHDFERDPIRPVLRVIDGAKWLVAEQTTLGADNGIGVALALAALDADDLQHGPLEVLLTVDEEAGMGGARRLSSESLRGSLLINMDTEEWGALYVGCAGGLDVSTTTCWQDEVAPDGYVGLKVAVAGLMGGHSGIDIHRERGHAIKLLVRLLRDLETRGIALRVSAIKGGTSRNALPREAFALLSVPASDVSEVRARCEVLMQQFRLELSGVDEGVRVVVADAQVATVMPQADQQRVLRALHAAPQGIKRWSLQAPGVVETSLNLGVLTLGEGTMQAVFMLRSLVDAAAAELAEEVCDLFALAGMETKRIGTYPGWRPNLASPLLAQTRQVFETEFGHPAELKVIHAGLECGLIGGAYPQMDMISFGPDIAGAHAPGEGVRVDTVAGCWQLLKALLLEVARVAHPA